MSGIAVLPRVRGRTLTPLEVFRDDGPLARALGRAGRAVPLPPLVLLVAGLLPMLALAVLEGDGAARGLAGAAVAWAVLLGGVSSGRPHDDRLRWGVAAATRLTEYGGILWLATIGDAPAAAFALLAALAFRHYDLVYRLRYQGVTPAPWVGALGGGWEIRLLAAYALLMADAAQTGLLIAAAVLGVVFVAEAVASWAGHEGARRPMVYEDEEDEGQ